MSIIFCGGGTSPVGEAFTVPNGLVTSYDLVTECSNSGINNGSQIPTVSAYDDAHNLVSLGPHQVGGATLELETAAPRVGENVAVLGDFPGTSATLTGEVTAVNTSATIELPGSGSIDIPDAFTVSVSGKVPIGNIGGPAIDAAGNALGVVVGVGGSGSTAIVTLASDVKNLLG